MENTKNPLTTKAGQNNAAESGGTGATGGKLAAKVQSGANKGLEVAPDVTDIANTGKK